MSTCLCVCVYVCVQECDGVVHVYCMCMCEEGACMCAFMCMFHAYMWIYVFAAHAVMDAYVHASTCSQWNLSIQYVCKALSAQISPFAPALFLTVVYLSYTSPTAESALFCPSEEKSSLAAIVAENLSTGFCKASGKERWGWAWGRTRKELEEDIVCSSLVVM